MIPLFKPSCGEEEIQSVTRVLRSGWWGMGPEVEAFEAEFANAMGVRHAVAVSSGTMALELAGRATGLEQGIVVLPALTFVSTALAMEHLGNHVVFADVNEGDLTLNWYDAASKLNIKDHVPGPRGAIPVWYGGHVNDLIASTLPACTRVIEDCAHAAGATKAGQIGRAACWSFHAVKNLATGDGGMVTTDDEHVAREVRRLRWCGIDRSTWERDKGTTKYGWNYNITTVDGEKAHMNDITAALGRVQLKYLFERNHMRREIAGWYNEAFRELDWLRKPKIEPDDSGHLYVVRLAESRDRFIQHMLDHEVSAGVHYKPLHLYKDRFSQPLFGPQGPLPITDKVWQEIVTLPLFPDMTVGEVEKVIEAVRCFR